MDLYRIKSDGRYKACLVASGFQQQYNNNVIYIDTCQGIVMIFIKS